MTDSRAPVRHVVTGHDADGNAVTASDGPPPTSVSIEAVPGTVFHGLWSTASVPASVDNGPDPTLGPLQLAPPAGGTRTRIVDIPPDSVQNAVAPEDATAAFAQIGAGHGVRPRGRAVRRRASTTDEGVSRWQWC
jgi:hypothetical protein